MVSSGEKRGILKTKTRKTLRLEKEGSNLKPLIWLTLDLTTPKNCSFRPRGSQIDGFGLPSSFPSFRGLSGLRGLS